ncbi:AKAP7 2'5' RNA ligase-like domain protein [Cryptosporidium meleagridis]|uniref:AKAP7 2'5' RNA ligase-like domain protein n=1 Tax=Cryptosporidium meleagridis TaxID=93969 RepID=A0A2P4YXP0_9CRYT|nr:AKAP7 2'5' RNA ligase-like domain protein [Cryptosporidium meleagridis]
MVANKIKESKKQLKEEIGFTGAERSYNDKNSSQNSHFHSHEIEKLDEIILFPPVKAVEIRDNIFQRPGDKESGRMVSEYVDLSQIPVSLIKKFSFKPTSDVQVVNEDSDFSNSESEESEEAAKLGSNFDHLDFLDYLEERYQNDKINQTPTHFFSLAFNQHSLNLFKEFKALKKVVNESAEYGEIQPTFFIGEKKLHITLGLVRAETPQELLQCENALFELKETQEFQEILEESSSEKGFPVELHGLGYFGSPHNTRVIYAKISENHKIAMIKRLWIKLCEILIKNGVNLTISDPNSEISNKSQNLKDSIVQDYTPHVTFINTKYGNKSDKQKLTFNSSNLIKTYSKKSFGPGYISEIQLNELSGIQEIGAISSEQAYKTISSIKINRNE